MRQYLQHGRRHGPGGSDPIPGLGTSSLPFIVANGFISVTSFPTSNNYVDLNLYATNNDTLFGIEVGTGSLSATNGISVSEYGVYRAWLNFQFTSGTNGDTLIAEIGASSTVGTVSHWGFSNTQQKDDERVIYSTTAQTGAGTIEYARLMYFGGDLDESPAPLPGGLFVSARSPGGNNFNLQANVILEQLSTSYSTNGSFGVFP